MADEQTVVPLHGGEEAKSNTTPNVAGIEARWGARLATPFNPVSRYFLHNYHRLRPHPGARGLTNTEAMLVIQILDHKWDHRAPFPTVTTLSKRMGLTPRAVRDMLKRLEDLNFIRREPSVSGPNRYHFDGLLEALHLLMDADVVVHDQNEAAVDG